MAKQTFTTGQVLLASQLTSLQQTAMLGGSASNKTNSYTLVAADAGAAISMTSTSATTITVNTGLFAAGDTVQITNLSTGVCTITAGTATVNSSASLALAQYESGTLDFTSASAAIFIKGAGAAAASGLTLVSTNSFSASNQVNVDSVFTSTYQQYKIFINLTAISAATNIMFRLRVGGVTNSGNDYTYIGWDVNDAGGSGAAVGTATSRLIQFASNTGAATGTTIEIFNPQQTLRTKAFLQHTTGTQYRSMAGFTSVTTSYDGFSLVADTGETITGNYWVLGYQKS